MTNNLDFIGDIHGHYDALVSLLEKMGYEPRKGSFLHPEGRKVIFVGDFIDRGPKIRETLHLVRNMCERGDALAVMGNHEFNAICFHTKRRDGHGYYRSHSETKVHQHRETIEAFRNHSQEWTGFLDWFKELPIYLDLGEFRAVHAFWQNEHVDWIKRNNPRFDHDFLQSATDRENSDGVYRIVEELLKGPEIEIPEGHHFLDKDGHPRKEARLKWWAPEQSRSTLGDILVKCPIQISNSIVPNTIQCPEYSDNIPVFFGHYWLDGTPIIENENAICLDYSVARGGVLVSCRMTKSQARPRMELIF
jgi:hypothetical protein